MSATDDNAFRIQKIAQHPTAREGQLATTSGTILRAAWRKSEGCGWRIGGLILILLVPTILVHALGEVVLDIQNGGASGLGGGSVADYARFAERGLATFMAVSSIASFFTVTLVTAGSVGFYRQLTPTAD